MKRQIICQDVEISLSDEMSCWVNENICIDIDCEDLWDKIEKNDHFHSSSSARDKQLIKSQRE